MLLKKLTAIELQSGLTGLAQQKFLDECEIENTNI